MSPELLAVLIGGPILAAGPPALAILLCERHANQSASAIRAQHGIDEPAPARRRPSPRPARTEVAR